MSSEFVIRTEEGERRKRQRAREIAVVEIPTFRVIGSVLLSLGVYLNNRFLLHFDSNADCRIDGRRSHHKGDTVYVTTDPANVHVFDTESGIRLS